MDFLIRFFQVFFGHFVPSRSVNTYIHTRKPTTEMQSHMTYTLLRKTNAVSILAVSFVFLITWKLSGFLAEEEPIKLPLGDGGQRCRTVLQQIKSIKLHPEDKASIFFSLLVNGSIIHEHQSILFYRVADYKKLFYLRIIFKFACCVS